MKTRFQLLFFCTLLLFVATLATPFMADAQPTPADITTVIDDGPEYIEYGGTITMYGDSTGTHYSSPFAINRIAGQAGTLRLTTSNPQDPAGIDIRVRVLTTYDRTGSSGYTALSDSTDISASTDTWMSVGGANGTKFNTAYWAVIEAEGLTTTNRDSTLVDWVYRGYRTVQSHRNGLVKN